MPASKWGQVRKELSQLQTSNGGVLLPLDVVNAAKLPSSPLHAYFEWDDTKAAHSHRLWQARQLIVEVITVKKTPHSVVEVEVQEYVSLPSDRKNGGGYRDVVAVLSNPTLRDELLESARQDMLTFRRKYVGLKELDDVFSAMVKVV
jgi:DNA-binding cell septation regulator SpoVG